MSVDVKQALEEIQSRTSVIDQKFELVAVTPVLVHGANKGTAEWRSPSVRGMLRYWWRAARWDGVPGAGGKSGPAPKELLKEEMTWFGGSAGEKESSRSPVDVLTYDNRAVQKAFDLLLHRQEKRGTSIGFQPGSVLKLAFQPRSKLDRLGSLRNYSVLLDWWILLGGLGLRSRRGYGSLARKEWAWRTVADYVQELSRVIQAWRTVGAGFAGGCTVYTDRHVGCVLETRHGPTSHPTLRSVWVGKPLDDWRGAVRAIGEASHHANPGGGVLGKGGSGRLASPLHCTVKKIGDKYIPVVAEVHTDDFDHKSKRYEDAKLQFLRHLGVNVV